MSKNEIASLSRLAASAFARLPKPGKKTKWGAGIIASAALVGSSFTFVSSRQFAVGETLGYVSPKPLPPGLYVQAPFFVAQYTHPYNKNTQTFEFKAGSGRWLHFTPDTMDHNILLADVRLSYQVVPDTDKLSLHLWEMQSWGAPDGYWTITKLMNDSANAVFGRHSMAEILNKPEVFEQEFFADLTTRLDANNIPIKIERLELKGIETGFVPTRTVVYETISAPAPQGPGK